MCTPHGPGRCAPACTGLLSDAFTYDWDQPDALAAYDEPAKPFWVMGYDAATSYLAAARPHAFTFLDDRLQRALAHLGGVELGTGVIERVMRELNARTDIGGSRWTIPGLRDLVTPSRPPTCSNTRSTNSYERTSCNRTPSGSRCTRKSTLPTAHDDGSATLYVSANFATSRCEHLRFA